jgi:hypothetical protein
MSTLTIIWSFEKVKKKRRKFMEEIEEGYTRVSAILSQWNHLAGIPKHILDNKCRIGTNVHAQIGASLQSIYIATEEDEKGYVESWENWYIENPLDVYLLEKRFYDEKLKITGKVDLISKTKKGLQILDFKTSANPNPQIWSLQGAFYHYLCKTSGLTMTPQVLFIHLQTDGQKAQIHEFQITTKLWKVCEAAFLTYCHFRS